MPNQTNTPNDQVDRDDLTQIAYSAVSESVVANMGLSHMPPLVLTPEECQQFAYQLLAKTPVRKPLEGVKTRRAPSVDIPEELKIKQTPFDHYGKNRVTMEEVIKWWCLPTTGMKIKLIEEIWRLFRLTRDVVKELGKRLHEVYQSIALEFYLQQEVTIGDKLRMPIAKLPENFDWSGEVLVVFEGHTTLLSGRADMIHIADRRHVGDKPAPQRVKKLDDNSFQTLAQTFNVNEDDGGNNRVVCIIETKREGNLKGKGAAQVQALVIGSMRISRRKNQAYIYATPSEWVFGVITVDSNTSDSVENAPASKFKHYQLEKVNLAHVDGDTGGFDLRINELEGLFVLWTAWTITPAKEIVRLIKDWKETNVETEKASEATENEVEDSTNIDG